MHTTALPSSVQAQPRCPRAVKSHDRCIKKPFSILHALPNAGEHPSVGMVGKRNAQKLHQVLKASRKRLERNNTKNSAAISAAPTQQPVNFTQINHLEAEFQALMRQLKDVSQVHQAGSSNVFAKKSVQPQASVFGAAPSVSRPMPPAIDFDNASYLPRHYESSGRVMVCQGSKCKAQGALGILQAASSVVGQSAVEVLPCKCLGKCSLGPVMRVKGEGEVKGLLHLQLKPTEVGAVLDSHFAV